MTTRQRGETALPTPTGGADPLGNATHFRNPPHANVLAHVGRRREIVEDLGVPTPDTRKRKRARSSHWVSVGPRRAPALLYAHMFFCRAMRPRPTVMSQRILSGMILAGMFGEHGRAARLRLNLRRFRLDPSATDDPAQSDQALAQGGQESASPEA